MLVGQDIENLLFQLVGSHMISVFGGANQVVAHFLLLPAVCGVLGTVGLEEGGTSKSQAWIGSVIDRIPTELPQIRRVCAHPLPSVCSR